MARMGFSGGGHVVSEEAKHRLYVLPFPVIYKCHPAPGRNITYATIDCVTSYLHE